MQSKGRARVLLSGAEKKRRRVKYKRLRAKQSRRQQRNRKILTRSIVKLRVDGNLKVVAVEVGRLVQHRQHILDQI